MSRPPDLSRALLGEQLRIGLQQGASGVRCLSRLLDPGATTDFASGKRERERVRVFGRPSSGGRICFPICRACERIWGLLFWGKPVVPVVFDTTCLPPISFRDRRLRRAAGRRLSSACRWERSIRLQRCPQQFLPCTWEVKHDLGEGRCITP